MGKYGYKFIGNAGFAMQYYRKANESLSSERNQSSESIDEAKDERQPMSANSGQLQNEVSSTEKDIADCLSNLMIALAKHSNANTGKNNH